MMRPVLLCMLEAVEDRLCLLEVLEGMLCMLEAVEGGSVSGFRNFHCGSCFVTTRHRIEVRY